MFSGNTVHYMIPLYRVSQKKRSKILKSCIFNSFVQAMMKICTHDIPSILKKGYKFHGAILSTFDTPTNWKTSLKIIGIIQAGILMAAKNSEKYFFNRSFSKLAGILVCQFAVNSPSFITIQYKMADLETILFWYPHFHAFTLYDIRFFQ